MKMISVIIPAYNAERFISETLDSLINQTYKNIEVIIMDDGSTDNTAKIAKKYSKKYQYINYYYQENQGQSAARNNSLKYVNGDYIFFLDSDDILNEDCFEKLYNAIEKNKADISICGYEKFYDDTNKVFYTRMPSKWDVKFDNNNRHVFHYPPWGKLYKTSFIKKYSLKFSIGEQLEDGPYCALAHLLAKKVVCLDFIGLRYRVYSDSTMGNIRKKKNVFKPPYNGVEYLIKTFNKYNKDDEKNQILEYVTIKILTGLVTNMYKTCNKKDRKDLCNYCYKIIDKYFPNVSKNPYIKIRRLKELPLVHRCAVRLFVFFYKLRLLYPFSLIVSKVL